jgi:hypothetical protein
VILRRILAVCATGLLFALGARGQQPAAVAVEPPVPLTQVALAYDSQGQRALEATLRSTVLNGAPDTPVTNTRIVLRNVSQQFYNYVSGHATFYDASGVRCGEGLFKTDTFAPNELVEVDIPGLRITCAAASWRIMAGDLLPRIQLPTVLGPSVRPPLNLVISIDGEEHPIQLGKPLVVSLGDKQRAIVVRGAP